MVFRFEKNLCQGGAFDGYDAGVDCRGGGGIEADGPSVDADGAFVGVSDSGRFSRGRLRRESRDGVESWEDVCFGGFGLRYLDWDVRV